MSIAKAYRLYQSLTPDQKTFIKEKRIEGWYAPAAWLDFFARVAEYDRVRDASSKRVTGYGCGCALLLLGLLIASFIVPPLFLVFLPALFFAIVFAVFFFKRRADVPNHLRQFVVPLVAVLREDVKPHSTIFLRVDLRGGTLAEKRVGNQLSPAGQRLQAKGSKITEEFFADQWLLMRALLADNTTLQVQALDRIRKRQEGKKRTSGKYKTKTKHKIKSRLEATLRFSNRRYDVATKPEKNSTGARLRIKQGAQRTKINIRRVAVSDALDKPVAVRELLQAISTAYRLVTPKGVGGKA